MKFGKKYDCITKTIQYDWYPYNKIKLEIENNTIKEIKFVENIVSTLKDLDQKYSKLVSLPINQSYAIFFEFTVILKLTLVAIYKICKKYDCNFAHQIHTSIQYAKRTYLLEPTYLEKDMIINGSIHLVNICSGEPKDCHIIL